MKAQLLEAVRFLKGLFPMRKLYSASSVKYIAAAFALAWSTVSGADTDNIVGALIPNYEPGTSLLYGYSYPGAANSNPLFSMSSMLGWEYDPTKGMFWGQLTFGPFKSASFHYRVSNAYNPYGPNGGITLIFALWSSERAEINCGTGATNTPSVAGGTTSIITGYGILDGNCNISPNPSNWYDPNPNNSHVSQLGWIQILYSPPSSMDLAVNSIQIPPQTSVSTSSTGVTNITPDTPTQINVIVSGSNLSSSQSQNTSVVLQAGTQKLTQTVSLASIQSAGTLLVPFNVTFAPKEVGLQTITATVDPGNSLGESNFTNNASSIQVKVVPPYKLVAFLDGSTTPIPDEGGSQTLVPSVKACGALKDSENGDTDIEIRCVQVGDPAYVPVAGCKFILDLSQGPDSGGHTHNANDESRPFVLDPFSPSFPVGQFLSVDSKGNGLTYTPPEVAGDVFLQIAGTDPNGNQIAGPSYLFHIQDTDLGNLVSLNGVGASANNSGISVVTNSHPGAGIYGTQAMQTAVSNMVEFYYENADDDGVTNPPRLASQAATLIFGGLFDANWNGSVDPIATPWAPPHCGHRDGVTIDLSLSQFIGSTAAQEKSWLQFAARDAGLIFTNPAESPKSTNANHWHAHLKSNQ